VGGLDRPVLIGCVPWTHGNPVVSTLAAGVGASWGRVERTRRSVDGSTRRSTVDPRGGFAGMARGDRTTCASRRVGSCICGRLGDRTAANRSSSVRRVSRRVRLGPDA